MAAVRPTSAVVCLVLTCSALSPCRFSMATEFFVSNASEIAVALQSAEPGDVLTMANGYWTNQQVKFSGFGTASNPIRLRAETPGQVILNGNSTLDISGNWLEVDGLKFEEGALAGGGRAIVEFRGRYGPASNSRFTNSAIIGYNPTNINDRYHWVELFGQNNRVDNNYFENHDHSGVTVSVRRDSAAADFHQIDHNHFADRPEGNGNGFETIRIGTSHQSLSDSYTTVENNLFERIDGEIEIISNKSGSNAYRYNTFRASEGTLTLRHGNDTLVEGNFFLGESKQDSGGIRVIGERQTIVNNYIANVDDRGGGAISISAGVPDSAANQYFQVKDTVLAHNTMVNTAGTMLTFDDGLGSSGRTLLAENVTVANNLFRSKGPAIFEGNEGSDWLWEGNIAFGGSLGPKLGSPGITTIDPQLQYEQDGLWRLSPSSPARDSAVGDNSTLITDDMDGQPRIGLADVGADEFSLARIIRKPLEAGDVGPDWIAYPENPSTGGGCFATGCAIQAEEFSAILDPDGNGAIWSQTNDPLALGGEALQAPFGDLVDYPSEAHDTVAVYDVVFQQPGTYQAYYRALGYDSSTNSFYVPDDFGVDPEHIQETSSNSMYQWESGGTFTITPADVDVPLEFRIGKRENIARLDAIVLALDPSLSSAELDALFETGFDAGDFDEDGDVDRDDLSIWKAGYGTNFASHTEGDADGDGDVDGEDFLVWQSEYTFQNPSLSQTSVPEATGLIYLALCILQGAAQYRFRPFAVHV